MSEGLKALIILSPEIIALPFVIWAFYKMGKLK